MPPDRFAKMPRVLAPWHMLVVNCHPWSIYGALSKMKCQLQFSKHSTASVNNSIIYVWMIWDDVMTYGYIHVRQFYWEGIPLQSWDLFEQTVSDPIVLMMPWQRNEALEMQNSCWEMAFAPCWSACPSPVFCVRWLPIKASASTAHLPFSYEAKRIVPGKRFCDVCFVSWSMKACRRFPQMPPLKLQHFFLVILCELHLHWSDWSLVLLWLCRLFSRCVQDASIHTFSLVRALLRHLPSDLHVHLCQYSAGCGVPELSQASQGQPV